MNAGNLSAIARSRVRKPPREVFRAFADADEMSKFWFTRRDDGLKEGESVKWYLGDDAEQRSILLNRQSFPLLQISPNIGREKLIELGLPSFNYFLEITCRMVRPEPSVVPIFI